MSRLALMTGFGFASGLPLLLSGFVLQQWLSERGVPTHTIGLIGLVGWAYTLKFLWAPLLDHVPPPGPMRRFGRRRGWLLCVQPVLALAIAALAFSTAWRGPSAAIAIAALVAFCSATQDIDIDAWRIESFAPDQQGLANAVYVWGYRIGMLVARSGVLAAAVWMGWRGALLGAAGLAALSVAVTLIAPEPSVGARAARPGRLGRAVTESLRDFLAREGALPILAYVALFNLGEAMAGVLTAPFYRHLGFDRATVAAVGPFGLFATMAGTGVGGWLVAEWGVARALIATGCFQMLAMAAYIALALSAGDHRVLIGTVTLEAFAQGTATAAFLAYLSGLCSTEHTATQFALLTSVAPLAANTVGSFSGYLQEAVGWPTFYALAMLAAVPGIALMLVILRRYPLDFGRVARAQT